jgi:hypothetical protein
MVDTAQVGSEERARMILLLPVGVVGAFIAPTLWIVLCRRND